MGDADKAKASFEKSVAGIGKGGGKSRRSGPSDGADIQYAQARALQRLGRADEAVRIFDGLVKSGQGALSDSGAVDFFAKFGERQSRNVRLAQAHYGLGLGLLGSGKQSEAKAEFQKALELNPNHLGANYQLSAMGK
jgi:tetratricopeptide (TPR) repeat protein